MKAITLKHPWAWAICYAGKRIENREWAPYKDLIGQRIAIHGGVVPEGTELRIARQQAERIGAKFLTLEQRQTLTLADLITPGVVCVATLTGLVRPGYRDPWYEGSAYGWKLADVIVLDEPIQIRGKQGIWQLPEDVSEQLEALRPATCHPERPAIAERSQFAGLCHKCAAVAAEAFDRVHS